VSGKPNSTNSRHLNVDRALYIADDDTRTYRYLRRNPRWADLALEENERNKRSLDGYTRLFPDGRRRVFRYRPPYTTPAGPPKEE
jgi:hypothetical protein